MNNRFLILCALVVLICQVGCGDGKLRTKGRIVKDGKDFAPVDGQLLQITFVPMPKEGELVRDHYFAEVDQTTGAFMPAGKDGNGMPAGKYRVAVELMEKRSDTLNGKYDQVNSPFIFDVDNRTKEIVIDFDHPPALDSSSTGKL